MKLVNPLHPVRLALLWVLGGIPLERHTAAILRIDEAHQERVARLRRQTCMPNTVTVAEGVAIVNGAALDNIAAGVAFATRGAVL